MSIKTSIVIHCSDVSEKKLFDQYQSINEYHRDVRGFTQSVLGDFVGYHSLITGNKNYKCREDWEIGCHCNQEFNGVNIYPPGTEKALSMNIQSLGVCWAGDGDHEFPSNTHYDLLQKQVWAWQDAYGIPNSKVFFHRKFNTAKTCPGNLITDAWLDKLLARVIIPTESCTALKVEVEEQKGVISNLKVLIQSLINLINKPI